MPSKKIALMLGASEYPHTNLPGGPQFRNSAASVREYFRVCIGADPILDLFDSEEPPSAMLETIAEFLSHHRHDTTDLYIYYVGHGDFVKGAAFALAIRRTKPEVRHATTLIVEHIAYTVKECFSTRRIFLILDCCYAGEAVVHFQGRESAAIHTTVLSQLPKEGTALLLAASRDDTAYAYPDEAYTRFTGALLSALGELAPDEKLSLFELGQRTTNSLTKHAIYARPEVHSPRQPEGDIAHLKVFPSNCKLLEADEAGPGGPDARDIINEVHRAPHRLATQSAPSPTDSEIQGQSFESEAKKSLSAPRRMSSASRVLRSPVFWGIALAGTLISAAIIIANPSGGSELVEPRVTRDETSTTDSPLSLGVPGRATESDGRSNGESFDSPTTTLWQKLVRGLIQVVRLVGAILLGIFGISFCFSPAFTFHDRRNRRQLLAELASGSIPKLATLETRQEFSEFLSYLKGRVDFSVQEREELMALIMQIDDRPLRTNEVTRRQLRHKINAKINTAEGIPLLAAFLLGVPFGLAMAFFALWLAFDFNILVYIE